MTEQSQSCVSSDDKFGAPLPTATLVEDGVIQVAVVPVVVDQAPNQPGGLRWFFIGLGWLLTALTQFIVAMVVRAQGIEVIDYWIAEVFYPRAGNPWIGLLNLVMAAIFLMVIVGCQYNDGCGSCIGCFYACATIVCAVSFCWSFFERDVYNALKDNDECVDTGLREDYSLDGGGDCYCWDYESGGTPPVNVDASTACDNILNYVDSILVSYTLMNIVVVFSMAALIVWCSSVSYVIRSTAP